MEKCVCFFYLFILLFAQFLLSCRINQTDS